MQPPASLVAVASACLQAAPPNAQCLQALCRLARCLTIQSTGHTPASRVMPVISNVMRLARLRACSIRAFGRRSSGAMHPFAAPLGGNALAWPASAGAHAASHCLRSATEASRVRYAQAGTAFVLLSPLCVVAQRPPFEPSSRLAFTLRLCTAAIDPSSLGLRITRQSTGLPPAAGYRQR